MPLARARLAFAADGTPFSEEFGDVYHSAAGGPAQARHVFLEGNGLPARWRGRRSFTILETGFGLGLNFLATWKAWRDDPDRPARLFFVSIEKFPLSSGDLKQVLAKYPEFRTEAQELLAAWPLLVPGAHRLEFDGGNVALTLFFADVAVVRELSLAADAFYLDGFAPAKNPEMWSPAVLRALSRLAAPGATAATWSVAALVRESLERTGFEIEKQEGFGGKREMLVARYSKNVSRNETGIRSAIVIGAGIAGASVCERLCARGWEVTLIERHAAPAAEASGNPAGIFHPLVAPDDSVLARLTRAAYLYLLRHWRTLDGLRWSQCGVLQLARDDREIAAQKGALEALGLPPEYAQWREPGGLWFPQAGWVDPVSLVEKLIARCGSRLQKKFGVEVDGLVFSSNEWICFDSRKNPIAKAPVAILANAADALRLAPQPQVRLRRVRGQLSYVPAITGLEHVVLRGGFALPGIDGVSLVGASFDIDDEDPAVRADSHAGNLERLERLLPGASAGLDPAKLEGRVGFRAAVRDRLPLIGPLEGAGPGLYGAFGYGSRGLVWSSLGGELLASLIEGNPLPLERKLVEAVAPARFARRYQRSSLMSS